MGIPGFTGGQVPGFSATGRAQRETQRPQQGQGWVLQLPEPRARPRPCPLAPAAGGPQHRLRALPARSSAPRCCCQPGTPGDAQSHPLVWRAPCSAPSSGAHGWHRAWSHGTGPRRCLSPTVPCFCHREPQPGSRGAWPQRGHVSHGQPAPCGAPAVPPPARCCLLQAPSSARRCPVLRHGSASSVPAGGDGGATAPDSCPSPRITSSSSHHTTSHHITTSHRHHAPAPVSVCPGCSRAR